MTIITGTTDFQQMFQNELHEVVQVQSDDRNFIMPIVKLSSDSIVGTGDGASSISILGNGKVSTLNSTSALLGAGEVFTGGAEDVTEYVHIIVTTHSDVASATLGLSFQFYIDGEWHESDAYTVAANKFKTYSVQPVSSLFRVVYTNGSTPQTEFHIETQLKKAGALASSHRIGDTVVPDDDATLNQTIIKAKRPNDLFVNVDSTINGTLNVGIGDIQSDAGGRVRVSQFYTLGDYKILGYDHTLLWGNTGTGSGTWSNNLYEMSVQSGQYRIKESLRPHHYFSGKSQGVEATFDTFAPQTGTVKYFGYYSSQPTGTYTQQIDGIRVESNGNSGTLYLQSYRNGVETLNIPMEQWSGYSNLNSYQDPATWDNFTVCFIDFLWLGGAILRLWVKTEWGFVLAHVFHYSGNSKNVFINSPNQPIRYEIRSLGGNGDFRYICAQVATEGSVDEGGMARSVDTGLTALSLSTSGNTYPIKAIRKASSYRNTAITLEDIGILVSSADNAFWSIQIDPTLSAPLTYSAVPGTPVVEQASGNGSITVTSPGTIIASGYLTQNTPIPKAAFVQNFLAWLGGQINGTQQQYVLCVGAMTNNISVSATMQFKEF